MDITELPFVPDQDRPVFCRDCNRNRRGDRPERSERPQRQMNDVSHMGLKCAGCGTDITELPFVPDQDRPVYCRDCNRDRRPRF
jgi:CxxC-x17-CxxC domain-containing protein